MAAARRSSDPETARPGPAAPRVPVPRIVVALLVVAAAAPLLVAALVLADGWEPTGDVATIGVRSLDSWTGDAPLTGQPTTGDNYADAASFHPGPVEYWLVGPFVRTLGPRAGLVVAVAVVNAAALASMLWLAWRRGGAFLLATLAVSTACLVWSLGAGSLVDPMNSELAVYLMVLSVVAAWAVIDGDAAALPIFVVAASVTAQVHVSGVAFVAVPAVAVVLTLARTRCRTVARSVLAVSAAIAVLCWLPVVIQEVAGPSNVGALWSTLTTPHPRIGIAFALERIVGAVAPVPLFAHRSGPIGFARDVAAPALCAGAVLLGGWVAIVWRGQVLGRAPRSTRLAALVGMTLLVNTLVWAGNPPLAAFRADGARWLWVGSLLVWTSLSWSSVLRAPRAWRPALRSWFLPTACVVALGILGAAVLQAEPAGRRDREAMLATRSLADQVRANVEPGRYRVVLDGPLASFTVGPGVVFLLEADGYDTVFDEGALAAGFGDRSGAGGEVDGTLTIDVDGDGDPLAGREVARADVGSGARRSTVRVGLA